MSYECVIVATIRVEPSLLVFLAFISKSVNNQCYNPYSFGKISKRSFQKCMGVVALFLAFISKSVNNQCYNPYIFGKIFSRSFRNIFGKILKVVALLTDFEI